MDNSRIKNMPMFLAMRNIFFGGEFSKWLEDKEMPSAAYKEYSEAMDYFENETGFDVNAAEEARANLKK